MLLTGIQCGSLKSNQMVGVGAAAASTQRLLPAWVKSAKPFHNFICQGRVGMGHRETLKMAVFLLVSLARMKRAPSNNTYMHTQVWLTHRHRIAAELLERFNPTRTLSTPFPVVEHGIPNTSYKNPPIAEVSWEKHISTLSPNPPKSKCNNRSFKKIGLGIRHTGTTQRTGAPGQRELWTCTRAMPGPEPLSQSRLP